MHETSKFGSALVRMHFDKKLSPTKPNSTAEASPFDSDLSNKYDS